MPPFLTAFQLFFPVLLSFLFFTWEPFCFSFLSSPLIHTTFRSLPCVDLQSATGAHEKCIRPFRPSQIFATCFFLGGGNPNRIVRTTRLPRAYTNSPGAFNFRFEMARCIW
uniref:Putative secreted protein n=1 Tax=Ixodes ricinus TaxID=34613 RepID=A0A6B0UJD2_IXORI